MNRCSQGHESTTGDYCSVCGIELAAASATPVPDLALSAIENCPDCGTDRLGPEQVFCEVCGHNYRTGTAGVPPAPVARSVRSTVIMPSRPPATATSPLPEMPPEPDMTPVERWDVEVAVDGQLYGKPNPDAPLKQPKQVFTLFETETLIGRGGPDVRVHIPVRTDPGVSRRQAMLVCKDGGLFVRDVGSANGTQLNGVELVAGVDTPVRDGDSIAIGAWTRLTVQAKREGSVS